MNYLRYLLQKSTLYLLVRNYLHFHKDELKRFIEVHYRDNSSEKQLLRSMKMCFLLGGVRFSDFYQMQFEKKSWKERMDFVPRSAELWLYNRVNDNKYIELLEDKGECYKLFQKHYHRDLVKVSKKDILNGNAIDIISTFAEKHIRFIIKPINLYCGCGIQVLELPLSVFDIKQIIQNYQNGFVLEELIKQNKIMSKLHGNSVNTVRIVTVNYGDTIEIKWPFMRIGVGESVVDNAGAGGIIVAVDKSGKAFAAGDENRNSYSIHPESKANIIGFEIPKWKELCTLCKEMAAICPDCHIMGWDMAFTDNNEWVVVECNYGPNLVSQYVTGVGIKREFIKMRKKLGIKLYGSFIFN